MQQQIRQLLRQLHKLLQSAAPAPQAAAAAPQAHLSSHAAAPQAPVPYTAAPQAPVSHAPATAEQYNPFTPAPHAAAQSDPATAAQGYIDKYPDPDTYYHKSFQQLITAEKTQIKKNLIDSIYMTYDEFSKDQDCTPEAWLEHIFNGMQDNSVNPDHAVRFFRDHHLGSKAARALASWVTKNPNRTWNEFKEAFLARNPGKPPLVTRVTWKAITMKSAGTYHAYLQEFNRQKALISTGADEVVEQFLAGLTAQLRSQVEFLKNRNWHADEFTELVNATTERVNSSASSPIVENNKASHHSGKNKRNHSHMNAGSSNIQQPQSAGATDNAATAAYCLDKGLCTRCKRLGHIKSHCKYDFRPFREPRDWDLVYWQERAKLSATAHAARPGPPMPRPHYNKFQKSKKLKLAVTTQASLSDAACNNIEPKVDSATAGFAADRPSTVLPQPPAIADLPQCLIDNFPIENFHGVVETRLGSHTPYTGEQYCDMQCKPAKVLIDARSLRPVAFEHTMTAYLLDKQKHSHKEAVIITNNALTSGHRSMQTFRQTYTVGLRNTRSKIWHDPPAVLTDSQTLSSIYKCSLSGANAKILLDTGAAANCISSQFCKLMKIRVTPLTDNSAVSGISGQTEKVIGTAIVHTSIQSYKSKIRFLVVPMVPDYDAILGEPWHASTKAIIQYETAGVKCVKIYKGRTVRKIIQTAAEPMEGVSSKEPLMSHVQFNRARRKHGYFIAHIKIAPENQGGTSPTENQTQPSLSSDHNSKVDSKSLEKLLAEFEIVFEPLPKGLPPLRETTGHTIPLVEGAIPPYRSPYRMSPLELREVRKQIQELLENKFIQSSKSLFGIPGTLCAKKGWIFAHVHRLSSAK